MKTRYELPRPFDIVHGSCGGSQMWHTLPRRIRTGCGPTALANLYAWHNGSVLSRQEMMDLQETVWTHLKGPVISPGQFLRGAKRLFQAHGQTITADRLTLLSNKAQARQRAIRFIADALAKGSPPALLLGPQRPGSDYRRDVRNHWVIVTSMETNGKDAVLQVSSWGSLLELDLASLLSSKLFLSLLKLIPARP